MKKINKGQVYVPTLELTAPIRRADKNPTFEPSEKEDRSITDFHQIKVIPHGSHRNVFTGTLDTPKPWCG